MQAEKVYWRYQEDAIGVAKNNPSYPSKVDGNGALAGVTLSTDRNQDWFLGVSAMMMESAGWAEETHDIPEQNELKVQQQDVRVDLQYRMLGARFGLWVAQRKQTQERQNFYQNNVFVPVAGGMLSDEINSDWAGLSLTSVGGNVGQFETRIEVAAPIKLEMNHARLNQVFSRKDGYRTGIHFRWALPKQEVGVSGLNVTARYEYQELGGEDVQGNFWPYNRWQMAMVGLMYSW